MGHIVSNKFAVNLNIYSIGVPFGYPLFYENIEQLLKIQWSCVAQFSGSSGSARAVIIMAVPAPAPALAPAPAPALGPKYSTFRTFDFH